MNSDSLWAQSAQQFQQMLTQGWSQALESFQKMDLGANKAPMPMRMAPEKLQALQTQYLQEATELWQKSLQGQVAAEDRRFADVSWAQNPLASFSAAAYLLNARTMTQLAEAIELLGKDVAMIHFKDFLRHDADGQLKACGAGQGEMEDYSTILRFAKQEKPFVFATLENTTPENAVACREFLQKQYDNC